MMYGYYGFWDPTMLILIPGVIIAFIAQSMVQSAHRRYSQVRTRNGLTGAQAAQMILRSNGINGMPIKQIPGTLTDNYNPVDKVMNLSGSSFSDTVASVGVAAHEAGHAIQDAQGYFPLKIRNALVPVSGFCSAASWPLFLIGLVFARGASWGVWLMDAGIILFTISLLLYLVTLPVEFDASRRAVKALREQNLLAEDEVAGVKKVLTAAALTYVASMVTSLLTLVRLLVLRGNRN